MGDMDNPYDNIFNKTADIIQSKAGKFLGSLVGHYKVSEVATNFIVKSVNDLIDDYLTILRCKIFKDLYRRDGYLNLQAVADSLEGLRGQTVFEGVSNINELSSFLEEKSSNRQIAMKEVVLSSKTVWRNGTPKVVKHEYGYTFPFLPQLEQLLNCKDVWHCFKNPPPRLDGVFQDICDGLYVKHHPLVVKHGKNLLLIVIYCDDVDPCDGLKSKKGINNLRFYYWLLINIHPDKRATLRAVNVIAIVKASVAKKYGNEPFLQDFKEDMQLLGTKGVVFSIFQNPTRLWALLVFAAGDMPAMSNLGGFKESHFALRPCRVCMVLSSDLCKCFREDLNLVRKKESHSKQLEIIERSTKKKAKEVAIFEDHLHGNAEIETEYNDHNNPSVNYGIKKRSILDTVPGFDVTKCFPNDILHLLCEGVTENVCRLILRDVCFPQQDPTLPGKKGLSLDYINTIILDLSDLGHWNKKRPSKILKDHLFRKLGQSASQMVVLANLLPIILVNQLPRDKLELLLMTVKMLNLSLSFKMTFKDVDELEILIEEFGNKLSFLYPECKTPKLHTLIHLGSQIKLFGPLRYHMTFQFESMHSIFTSYLKVTRSMKNPAFSVGKRFLLRRNAEILENKDCNTFLYKGDEMNPVACILSNQQEKAALLEVCPFALDNDILKTSKLKRHGYIFRNGVVIYLGTEDSEKQFGRIESVFFVDQEIVISYNPLKCKFVKDLNCYEISKCSTLFKCVKMCDLSYPFPVTRFSFTFMVPQRVTKAYLLDMNFNCL
ncbi:Protein fem-1-like protein A [Frankliniella fusca]|uniref:Protein fem-1-like protein A n=1 Tax=Frankliniella fusca TaxID=407009 RepID=A0AAE1HWN5_9NEOP|nr:Protein fem-1-like protein A [Frankliniella fusca]